MRRENSVSRIRLGCNVLPVIVLASLLTGCMHDRGELAGVHDVFQDHNQLVTGSGVPPEATKATTYDVAFEDMFRLANISASQAQLDVEDVQKSSGLIYATRSTMRPVLWVSDDPLLHRYFYAISVTELGPKQTQVRIMAKLQGQCPVHDTGSRVAFAVASMGMTEVVEAIAPSDRTCAELNTPHWALNKEAAEQEMSQFLVFLRNNLLAARLI